MDFQKCDKKRLKKFYLHKNACVLFSGKKDKKICHKRYHNQPYKISYLIQLNFKNQHFYNFKEFKKLIKKSV